MVLLFAGLLLAFVTLPCARSQFPKACVNFQSLKNKECCPVPNGFNAPCGNDGGRGKCQELVVPEWNISYSHYKDFHDDDDRSDWPNALYNKTCKCNSNFAGYDCGKCEYGYHGNNCAQRKILMRKNFVKLSAQEKDRYMRYINLTRYADSNYVVTNASYNDIKRELQDGRDPTGLFFSIKNYDLFVWLHYYAARDTIHPDGHTDADIDFAHDGQGFPSWHRLYMLAWERTIQELANDENFTVPYWDWTENKDECEICTKDLLGVKDTNGRVTGKYFNDWYIICTEEQTQKLTRVCDPTLSKPGLMRVSDREKQVKEEKGWVMTFPTKEEVHFALRFETFDLPPYSKESSCNFRNILEGYASTKIGYRMPNAHTLHNNVHIVIGGTMGDVSSASNDPIFPLHHAFVDRIYEKWLRKYNKDASALSTYDAPIGHNRGDVIIPMFPVYTHEQMFKKSLEFGYDYEDVDEDGNSSDDEKPKKPPSLGQCPLPCPKAVASEAAVGIHASSVYLMMSMIAGELFLAGFLVKDLE